MRLNFLPEDIRRALCSVGLDNVTEVRLRLRQPVIIGLADEYRYLGTDGICEEADGAIVCTDVEGVLTVAMGGSVFAFTEQLKRAYITVSGVRIGIAGEYVTERGQITAVKNISSLNIRIPHDVRGCASAIAECGQIDFSKNVLLFSRPGLGKTTILRDLCRTLGERMGNILVFDERGEISATGEGGGYDLGAHCDVVRGADKLCGFGNAIRTMKPQMIVTDELYGKGDIEAAEIAAECGIAVLASTHIQDRKKLLEMPFGNYVELTGIGKPAKIYDKDFNFICDCSTVGTAGRASVGGKEEESKGIRRVV